jgi:helix-turn-helix protein
VQRFQHRPIAHVAAEMGISRVCAAKWVNRYRPHGELGLVNRSPSQQRSVAVSRAVFSAWNAIGRSLVAATAATTPNAPDTAQPTV